MPGSRPVGLLPCVSCCCPSPASAGIATAAAAGRREGGGTGGVVCVSKRSWLCCLSSDSPEKPEALDSHQRREGKHRDLDGARQHKRDPSQPSTLLLLQLGVLLIQLASCTNLQLPVAS